MYGTVHGLHHGQALIWIFMRLINTNEVVKRSALSVCVIMYMFNIVYLKKGRKGVANAAVSACVVFLRRFSVLHSPVKQVR